jgi:hypothetical protein
VIFELKCAGEIFYIQRCWTQNNPGIAKGKCREVWNIHCIWRVGRSEVWLEHMAWRGNIRKCCWESNLVQSVKGHQCSNNGLGIYPTEDVDLQWGSSRVCSRQWNEWICFSGNIFLASEWPMNYSQEKCVKTYSNSLLTGLPATI